MPLSNAPIPINNPVITHILNTYITQYYNVYTVKNEKKHLHTVFSKIILSIVEKGGLLEQK